MYDKKAPKGYSDEIKITESGLSIRFTLFISMKRGMTRATGGTNIMIKVEIRKAFLNRIREAEITNPAREAVTLAKTTIAKL